MKKDFPDGTFYSAIPNPEYLKQNKERIWKDTGEYPGIDLNIDGQLELLNDLKPYFHDWPYNDKPVEGYRYHTNQWGTLEYDARILHSMIRYYQPQRIIEAGCGFSSAVMLDVNEHHFNGGIDLFFIDPYIQGVKQFIHADDDVTLYEGLLQDIPLERFTELERNDILYIDTSHVSKTGSEVNYIVHEILPELNRGVLIHFHDVFDGFEYPWWWVLELGWYWNEQYILRAFLEYNNYFDILFFGDYLDKHHHNKLLDYFRDEPLNFQNLWIKKK